MSSLDDIISQKKEDDEVSDSGAFDEEDEPVKQSIPSIPQRPSGGSKTNATPTIPQRPSKPKEISIETPEVPVIPTRPSKRPTPQEKSTIEPEIQKIQNPPSQELEAKDVVSAPIIPQRPTKVKESNPGLNVSSSEQSDNEEKKANVPIIPARPARPVRKSTSKETESKSESEDHLDTSVSQKALDVTKDDTSSEASSTEPPGVIEKVPEQVDIVSQENALSEHDIKGGNPDTIPVSPKEDVSEITKTEVEATDKLSEEPKDEIADTATISDEITKEPVQIKDEIIEPGSTERKESVDSTISRKSITSLEEPKLDALISKSDESNPSITSPEIPTRPISSTVPHIPKRPNKLKRVDSNSSQSSTSSPVIVPQRPIKPISRTTTEELKDEIFSSYASNDESKESKPKSKGPPPVPKKPSSKIAAFQEMLRKNQDAAEAQLQKTTPIQRKSTSDSNSDGGFKQNLNNLFALPGLARPGAAIPTAISGAAASQDDETSKDADEPATDARRSRAKGPRGKRLPKAATEKVEKEDKRSIKIVDIWSSGSFRSESGFSLPLKSTDETTGDTTDETIAVSGNGEETEVINIDKVGNDKEIIDDKSEVIADTLDDLEPPKASEVEIQESDESGTVETSTDVEDGTKKYEEAESETSDENVKPVSHDDKRDIEPVIVKEEQDESAEVEHAKVEEGQKDVDDLHISDYKIGDKALLDAKDEEFADASETIAPTDIQEHEDESVNHDKL